MEKSESIKNISAALLQIQKDMQPVGKNAENPFFKSDYASLDAIQLNLHPILAKNGITYAQMPELDAITTLVVHPASGEYISSSCALNSKEHTPQSMGSAITYAKRYALVAMFGVIIKDDDDGNAAQPKVQQHAQPTPRTTPSKPQAAPTQAPTATYGDRQYTCPTCKNTATVMSGVSKKNGKPYKALKCGADKTHIFWDSSQEYFDVVNGGTDDYGNTSYQDTLES